MGKTYWMSIAVLLVALAVGRAGEERVACSIAVDNTFLFGSINGYLQTPAGGEPGTTSSKRPTFDELGWDRMSGYDALVRMQWKRHMLYGGAQLVGLSGSQTLTSPLISQAVSFDAGDRVQADVQLDWYRIGYLHQLGLPGNFQRVLSLSVGGDVALFDFHYRLDGLAGRVDRAYTKAAVRLGGRCRWTLTKKVSVSASAFDSLPFSNTPSILTLELRGSYRLVKWRRVMADVYAGVAYNRIDYQDSQDVPNHIRAEMEPLLVLGLTLRY